MTGIITNPEASAKLLVDMFPSLDYSTILLACQEYRTRPTEDVIEYLTNEGNKQWKKAGTTKTKETKTGTRTTRTPRSGPRTPKDNTPKENNPKKAAKEEPPVVHKKPAFKPAVTSNKPPAKWSDIKTDDSGNIIEIKEEPVPKPEIKVEANASSGPEVIVDMPEQPKPKRAHPQKKQAQQQPEVIQIPEPTPAQTLPSVIEPTPAPAPVELPKPIEVYTTLRFPKSISKVRPMYQLFGYFAGPIPIEPAPVVQPPAEKIKVSLSVPQNEFEIFRDPTPPPQPVQQPPPPQPVQQPPPPQPVQKPTDINKTAESDRAVPPQYGYPAAPPFPYPYPPYYYMPPPAAPYEGEVPYPHPFMPYPYPAAPMPPRPIPPQEEVRAQRPPQQMGMPARPIPAEAERGIYPPGPPYGVPFGYPQPQARQQPPPPPQARDYQFQPQQAPSSQNQPPYSRGSPSFS